MSSPIVKEVVVSDRAPLAIGPYSQAIRAGGLLYVSGCIGLVRDTGAMVGPEVAEQTRQCLTNMRYIIEDAGSHMSKVVKCTVLLTDMANFPIVNAIYAEFFPENPPARATFAVVGLPAGAKVEIESICIA